MKKQRRPSDLNQRSKTIVGIATGEIKDDYQAENIKNEAAVALGKLGGAKGGEARAKSLTPKRRSEIARKAAQKRWGKNK